MSVSVCPPAYLGNHTAKVRQIFAPAACDRGSVILRRRCDMSCTSGFVDDVMFCTVGIVVRRVNSYAVTV